MTHFKVAQSHSSNYVFTNFIVQTTSTRLKLCFEAFLRDPKGNVKVADPVFSDDIIDSESTANEFAISEVS